MAIECAINFFCVHSQKRESHDSARPDSPSAIEIQSTRGRDMIEACCIESLNASQNAIRPPVGLNRCEFPCLLDDRFHFSELFSFIYLKTYRESI
jgi:hypothetical protein